MEQNQEFGPVYEIEEGNRTSSNNMQISQLKFEPLSDQDQAEVEELFKVN